MSDGIVACEVEIEVPFFDVDLMEIVWHGHYLKYFEVARCALLDKIGYNYMQMRASATPGRSLICAYVMPDRPNLGRKSSSMPASANGKTV